MSEAQQQRQSENNNLSRETQQNPVYQEIEKKLGGFNLLATCLQIFFVALAFVSVATSLAVATFSTELQNKGLLKPFAYTAAFSASLISAFSLNRKAADARTSWRMLNVGLKKHRNNPDSFTIEQLISCYAEAEDTLGHVVFNPPQQEARALKAENDELKRKLADLEQTKKRRA